MELETRAIPAVGLSASAEPLPWRRSTLQLQASLGRYERGRLLGDARAREEAAAALRPASHGVALAPRAEAEGAGAVAGVHLEDVGADRLLAVALAHLLFSTCGQI